jgi:membrane fusion protein, type I secretion system
MLGAYPGMDAWQRDVPRDVRWPAIMGIAALSLGMLAFIAWAVFAPLDGAVVASGSFVATGQNKQVQHLEGGIIRDLLIGEGDLVEAGQTAVRLDETPAKAKLRRLVLRKYRLIAMQARLEAQMQSKDDFEMPAALAKQIDDPEVQTIFDRQKAELQARRAKRMDEEEVLRKEILGLQESIQGYLSQVGSVERRTTLFGEELRDKKSLLERQLTRKTDVIALERAQASLDGDRGELMARIADSKERIARAEQQVAQLRSAAMQKSIEELRETESELDDIQEQARAQQDVLERVDVRAPVRGIVVKLFHHARGAVVAPGSIILELLPVNDELIIESRVNPSDISHVKEGQDALVRLTALNQRITPVIAGKVIYVSADAVAEQEPQRQADSMTTGRHSFIVRVRLDERDAHSKIENFRPTPGMPADVYIKTGQRTFFEYMLRPVLDSFSRAFREH